MNIFTVILIEPLANGLILFYNLVGGNLGLAIIVFSLLLRFVLNPLTKPYMQQMKKIKELAPQLEKIKERHKNDRLKLAQAQNEFYKQRKVNPGAGCIPYLFQIVILIAFFNVFNRTLRPDGDPTQRFNDLLYPALKFEQGEVINTKFLYLDMAKPDIFNLSFIPIPLPGLLLILAALFQYLSAKMMAPTMAAGESVAKTTPKAADDMQAAMQRSMTMMFPILTLVIGMNFPSGLALYWLLFSMYQFLQQARTTDSKILNSLVKRLGLVQYEKPKKGK
jgi:YidC/Oxa1 family membrane protein insertase